MTTTSPYNFNEEKEIERWFYEMERYLRIGYGENKTFVDMGTDFEGRKFAYDAFFRLKEYVHNLEKRNQNIGSALALLRQRLCENHHRNHWKELCPIESQYNTSLGGRCPTTKDKCSEQGCTHFYEGYCHNCETIDECFPAFKGDAK